MSINKGIVVAVFILTLIGCKNSHTDKDKEIKTYKANKEWKFIFKEKVQTFRDLKTDTLLTSFEYCNTTNEVQMIDDIKTACGCMVVHYNRKPIGINEEGEIKISLDLSGAYHIFSKTLIVYFDKQKPVILRVRGNKARR